MKRQEKLSYSEFSNKAKIAAITNFRVWPSKKELKRCFNIYSDFYNDGANVDIEFQGAQLILCVGTERTKSLV